MTSASASGKVILLGEHAVVYGRPALAVPVTQVQAQVEVVDSVRPGIWIDAPDIDLDASLNDLHRDQPIAAVIHKTLDQIKPTAVPPMEIRIRSSIPIAAGMGSGAAISVAVIRALAGYLQSPLNDETISNLAYEIEKLHHGTPSGIDNTVITYRLPIYYMKGRPIEVLHPGGAFTLVIGDSGIPAPTKVSVGDVRRLWESDRQKWDLVFDRIGDLASAARAAILDARWEELGSLMDQNHALLQELTVSSEGLDGLVRCARESGALGAKVSGGGRGGNMIALVPMDRIDGVSHALLSAGAKQVIATVVQD
jgi:mevalonate kinase